MTDMLETSFGSRHVKKHPRWRCSYSQSIWWREEASISEPLTLYSRIAAWDNSTRGLDSSTALEFVRALRIATDVARISTIVSIYQTSESLYDNFDKVYVIYEGRMHILTTPDFVFAVTNPSARMTAAEFASAFLASQISVVNRMDMDAYFKETFIIQAPIDGSAFFRLKDESSAYFSRGGILFFSLLWAALSSIAEIPALFAQRPILVKHAKACMYHPFIEAAALTIVDIPITFVTIMIFSLILYFMAGLQASAGQFLIALPLRCRILPPLLAQPVGADPGRMIKFYLQRRQRVAQALPAQLCAARAEQAVME
ncbi:ABC-2 type transporter domain containing protein [Lactarius tabidus]